MYELLAKGGLLMVPIALSSVLSVAILLERLWRLRRELVIPKTLVDLAGQLDGDGSDLGDAGRTPLGQVLIAALRNRGRRRSEVKEAVEEVGRHEQARLSKNLEGLSTIAAVAPLLGLLGTVLGMINVFQKVTEEGVGDPRILASGIWEALITTAAGMAVAIPALIFHRFLVAKVDGLVLELEAAALAQVDRLAARPTPEEVEAAGQEELSA